MEETIRSVLLQNYPNLQYIVIDGGSTDGSVEIIKKYAPWLDFWVSEKDRGQSHAINKGLKRCNGEWFNWINSDDVFLKNAFFNLFKNSGALAEINLVAGSVCEGANLKTTQDRLPIRMEPAKEIAIVDHRVNQPGMFYRISQLKPLEENLHYAMDYNLWVYFLSHNELKNIKIISDRVSFFRLHENSKTVQSIENFEKEEREVLSKICQSMEFADRWEKVLSPEKRSFVCPDKTIKIKKQKLKKAIADRHLFGSLRKKIHSLKFTDIDLLLLCLLEVSPWKTFKVLIKETIKKALHYESGDCKRHYSFL